MRAKTIQVECIGSSHGNLLSEPWYESDNRVKRQAASESRTAGCMLGSGTHLARLLIHSMDSPASSWFDCEA